MWGSSSNGTRPIQSFAVDVPSSTPNPEPDALIGNTPVERMATVESAPAAPNSAVVPAWQEIAETFEGSPKELVLHLAVRGLPLPIAGFEVDGGDLVIDLAWPDHRVAVHFDEDDELAAWLDENDWTQAEPDGDPVATALGAEGGR